MRDRRFRLGSNHFAKIARKKYRVSDGSADYSDRYLFEARQGDVEDSGWRVDRRETDDRDRVAGKEESVTSGRSILKCKEKTKANPEADRQGQQHRRLHKRWYQEDRH